MNRFIAIVWNARAGHAVADAEALIASASLAHSEWVRRWEGPGLFVLERPHASRAEAGLDLGAKALFLGAVFCGARAARTGDVDVRAVLESAGARAFTSVWGRYVLFAVDADNACVYVARDPSGALPCYMAQRGWAFAFFSHPEDVTALNLPARNIDWAYVARRLHNPRLVSIRTGIESIEELPPGALARIGQGRRSVSRPWRPALVAQDVLEGDAVKLRATLGGAVEDACAAWAGMFDAGAVRLSGGLDSSIVLACLNGRIDLQCINFATASADGDERLYARAAAAHAHVELHEFLRRPETVDLERASHIAPALNPPLWLADGETAACEAAFAQSAKIGAYFSGRGGDNVFFRNQGWERAADWARHHGVGAYFWRLCWSHARQTGAPFLQSVRRAIAAAARPGETLQTSAPEFISEKARALAQTGDETDVRSAALSSLGVGKCLHMRAIEDRINYFDHRPHADYVYPLVAQPVLEACLRMPSYALAPPGLDRGLARAAFAHRIAPQILRRGSKGRTNSYLAHIVLRHRGFLRDYLAGGALAEAGMVVPDVFTRMLGEAELMRTGVNLPRLMGVFSIEAWLRSWRKAPQSPEASATPGREAR